MKSKFIRSSLLAGTMAVLGIAAHGGVASLRQAVVLEGRPFPLVTPFKNVAPKPVRTLFVSPGKENGDGTEQKPWNDFQAALRALNPGDRLNVGPGEYPGSYSVDEKCRDGKPGQPIEVLFDRKATIAPGPAGSGVAIRRAFWRFDGLNEILGDAPTAALSIDGPARFIDVNRARISGGAGPGVRIGPGSDYVTISNSLISRARLKDPADTSIGIEVAGGTVHTLLVNNRLHENPAGAIRVAAPSAGGPEARELEIRGNTIRDGGAAYIRVEKASGVRILDNTIEGFAVLPESHGIVLDDAEKVVVRSNQLSGLHAGMIVGSADAKGKAERTAIDVTIDHNHLESNLPGAIAIDIEAGRDVRFVNNTVEGVANGVLVLGRSPAASGTVVANNLLLGVSDTAFVLADPKAAVLFDYNVVSPSAYSVSVEVGSMKLALSHFLGGKTMPHTKLVRGVKILNRDLARVSGVDIVDRGTPIEKVTFKGAAPDIGVAER